LAIAVVAAWALIQTVRVSAVGLAQSVLAGHEPAAWLFPACVDVFLGLTAPVVAFIVWRRTGLGVWVTAIVWFALSISDHLDGATAALVGPVPVNTPPWIAAGFLFLTALDLIALVLLTRRRMKAHYLSSERPAEP